MPIRFHAPIVDISEVEGVTRIILSVDKNLEAERYLMIQRQIEPSDEEVRSGMNDVYIETCGQGWSWYGHIESFKLFPGRIEVELDAAAASEIGEEGSVQVSFELPTERYVALRAALRRAFDGRSYYSEAA